jgi:DnaK suppressor protein
MEKKELEFFRKRLTQRLDELTQKSDATIAGLLNFTVNSADPLDQASLGAERDYAIRMLRRENKLIIKIKKALRKIEDGTFGICEICGEEIDINRIKSRSLTELCIGCKTNQESHEKLTCE